MTQIHQYDGWSYERLRRQRNRAHFLLEDPHRFVTVILSTRASEPQRLFCVDSPCYHAAGPLGEGDLVAVEDMLCLRCPWHNYLVTLEDGCEVRVEGVGDDKAKSGHARSVSQCTTRTPHRQSEQVNSDAETSDHVVHGSVVAVHQRGRGARSLCAAREADQPVHSSSSSLLTEVNSMPMPMPTTYPLQPLLPPTAEGGHLVVRRGKRVQRTHAVWLDEDSGILTIEIADAATIKKHPLRSDRAAGSIANGALCMQIAHIKEQGLDRL